ncbi:hypothetical protein A9G41_12970 [Gilliamella sp. Nev5-1]|uniref:BRO-N domain-containing protein n=1 Tax=Gilliamella sp. Nev5-1 TaxID=3120251 RepID=UPI000827EC0F|nr:BRO family protein [Gilliamella apicola]OCG66299.1 hypothetical protein A9G41_12970 [Gilliamella apicola]
MSNTSINLFTFNFNNSPVRTTEINNQIWFLANDVCSILEYKNSRRAIELHCKEKGVTKRYTLTKGGNQEMIYISEANLFRLIIKSKQEKAVIFEEWVMEDLLPTIRKTGSYSLTISTEQQQAIKQAVNERSYRTGEHYQAIYTKFYENFKIPRYQDLLASKFDEAIEWLGGVAKTRKDVIEVSRTNLICLVHHMLWLNDFYIDNRLYDVFKMLGSNFGIRLHDHFGDGAFVASMFKQQLEKKQLQKL